MYKNPAALRSGRRPKASEKTRKKRVDHILVEVCVILWKSKVVVVKDTPQLVTVRCNQSTESVSYSSLPVGIEIVRKRKQKAFVFQARYLDITLYAPIETLDKLTKKVT